MSSLKVLYAYSKGLRKYFVAAILFVIIETSFEVIIPLLMSDIIDVGIAQRDTSVFIEKGIQMMICASIFDLWAVICTLCFKSYYALWRKVKIDSVRKDSGVCFYQS